MWRWESGKRAIATASSVRLCSFTEICSYHCANRRRINKFDTAGVGNRYAKENDSYLPVSIIVKKTFRAIISNTGCANGETLAT